MQTGGLSRGMQGGVVQPSVHPGLESAARNPLAVAAASFQVRRILVPVDFSSTSLGAVRYSGVPAELFGAIETHLAEWANLGALGEVEVDPLPELERPDAHVLGRMLRRAGSDLIVTGVPRASWWYRMVHGGAAEQLRRVAPCPVLSVPQNDWECYAEIL